MDLKKDKNGIAQLIWALLILGGIALTSVVATTLFSQPNITYNISDTGFSLAGLDISWLMIILIVGLVFILLIYMGRKKSNGNNKGG